jgi:outer membrane immunogenic protein
MLRREDRIDGGGPRAALSLRRSYAAIFRLMEPISNLPGCCPLVTDLGGQVSYTEANLVPKEGVVIMKKMLLASTATLALVSGSAMAADMTPAPAPVYSKAPMVAPFSWTGFYIGGDGGYGFATSSGTSVSALGSVPYSFNVRGPIAGGFVGGNYQMGAVVFGAEADWQWANLTGNSGAVLGATMATTVKSYGSARGRLGFAVDHWLFFGTAGWAWGTWSTSYAPAGFPPFFTNSASSHTGWTAGAGFEYAFTNYLLGRVEYRYTNLGTVTYADAPSGSSERGNKVTISDIRAGLAFKFGGGYY